MKVVKSLKLRRRLFIVAKVVSISINTTDQSGKKQTTNINYINPQATNEKLAQFAQMLTALTTEIYYSTTKITKESVI